MFEVKRGDVFIFEVPMVSDSHIQQGIRPWLVVQNNVGNAHSPTTLVVPLTTRMKKRGMVTHVPVNHERLRPSMALCEQVQVVDVKEEEWKYVCTLSTESMKEVDTALVNAFLYMPD